MFESGHRGTVMLKREPPIVYNRAHLASPETLREQHAEGTSFLGIILHQYSREASVKRSDAVHPGFQYMASWKLKSRGRNREKHSESGKRV